MPTETGAVYKDLLPIPGETAPVTDPNKREIAHRMEQEPTDSHALAMKAAQEPEELETPKGVAQLDHDADVLNLGWNEPESVIPKPLVGGLPNEELWVLIRRFNKVRIRMNTHSEGIVLEC